MDQYVINQPCFIRLDGDHINDLANPSSDKPADAGQLTAALRAALFSVVAGKGERAHFL